MQSTVPARPEENRAALVRAELDKILESLVFSSAIRLSQFLTFVVEKSLAGEAGTLKETTVGVEVYGRQPAYDPKLEPIVRTEARRLRSKLEEYYRTTGCDDRVRIELPKGGYAPRFEVLPERSPVLVSIDPERGIQVAGARKRRRGWLLMAAAPTVALLCVAGWRLIWRQPAAILPPSIRPLTSYTGSELQPSLAPDGKEFAFVWDGGNGNFDIYVQLMDAGSPLRVTTDPAHDVFPAWSPDSRYVAFLRVWPNGQALYVAPGLGGPERKIAALSPAQMHWQADAQFMYSSPGPAWSADEKYLVAADCPSHAGPDALYAFPIDGGPARRLTSPEPDAVGDLLPAFSPSGRNLAFVRVRSQRGIADLYVQTTGAAPRRLTFDNKTIGGVTWANDRRILFTSNRSGPMLIWSIPADGGPPAPVLGTARGITRISASAAAGGVAYAETFRNTNVWRLALSDGKAAAKAAKLLFSSRQTESAEYSPNGQSVVFVSNRSGTRQILLANAGGENTIALTAVPPETPVGTPRWSPDGRQIVYDSVYAGRSAIFIMNADGTAAHPFAADAWDDMMPSWSRDGQTIYFACRPVGLMQVCKKALSGGATVQMTKRGGGEPRESPNGRTVFYGIVEKGIWQVPKDGGAETPVGGLAEVRDGRCWTVSKSGIFFVSAQKPWTLSLYRFSTGQITPVAALEREPVFGSPGLTVSPDEKSMLFTQLDDSRSEIMLLQQQWSAR